jgi:hypothetical protein
MVRDRFIYSRCCRCSHSLVQFSKHPLFNWWLSVYGDGNVHIYQWYPYATTLIWPLSNDISSIPKNEYIETYEHTVWLTHSTQLTLHRPLIHLQAILKLHTPRVTHNHVVNPINQVLAKGVIWLFQYSSSNLFGDL